MASDPLQETSTVSTDVLDVALNSDLQLGRNDPLIDARAAINESTPTVYKLVLTGGPCAGKTTALNKMGEFFREKG